MLVPRLMAVSSLGVFFAAADGMRQAALALADTRLAVLRCAVLCCARQV